MLEGRVAYVTGSSRGIGWVTAQTLARHGATVILNSRSVQSALEARVRELKDSFGTDAIGIVCDVAKSEEVAACYQTIFQKYRRLDILVNNAGVMDDGLLGMIPEAAIRSSFDINAIGVINNLQAAVRLMERNKSGSIVNVTSIIGTHGNAGQVVYAASKSAVLGITWSAAKELAPMSIRVNAVAPGFIDTDLTKGLPPDTYRQRLSGVRMGRVGTPADVANAILFFASDLSTYVTGQVLGVDGGMVI